MRTIFQIVYGFAAVLLAVVLCIAASRVEKAAKLPISTPPPEGKAESPASEAKAPSSKAEVMDFAGLSLGSQAENYRKEAEKLASQVNSLQDELAKKPTAAPSPNSGQKPPEVLNKDLLQFTFYGGAVVGGLLGLLALVTLKQSVTTGLTPGQVAPWGVVAVMAIYLFAKEGGGDLLTAAIWCGWSGWVIATGVVLWLARK